jgi:hypothetical protein
MYVSTILAIVDQNSGRITGDEMYAEKPVLVKWEKT